MFTHNNVSLFFDGKEIQPCSSISVSAQVSRKLPDSVSIDVTLKEAPVGTVLVPKGEYAIMQLRLAKLDALEAGGVDNWSGYGDCFEGDEDE